MKLSERQIYVVRGSEDGNLGVYSNVKRAWDRARQYLVGTNEASEIEGSYSMALKRLQAHGVYTGYAGSPDNCQITATIEVFNLNQ